MAPPPAYDAESITLWVDTQALELGNIEAPAWYINPELKALFKDRQVYHDLVDAAPITVAPAVHDALCQTKPPSLDFFRCLPLPFEDDELLWGVYAHLMELDGLPPKVYVGVGASLDGVTKRLKNYDKPSLSNLPKFVKLAFEAGYNITASGLLCWADIPPAALVPRNAARFKLLEAHFTIIFNACFKKCTDFYVESFLVWGKDSVE